MAGNSTLDLNHPQTHDFLSTAATALWYIGFPIGFVLYHLAILVLFTLKQLYRPLAFLSLPALYLGRFILACLVAPFQLLVKFETVYIYLGVAALTGIAVGLLVSFIYRSLHSTLRLDTERSVKPTRTAKEYREGKRKQQIKAESSVMSPSVLSPRHLSPDQLSLSDGVRRGQRARGLLNQTIMEEIDSEF
nr:hypothetical protein CFP56_33765 [Quercus suber]